MFKNTRLSTGLVLLASFATSLRADVIVGLPAATNSGNCIPFGCPVFEGLSMGTFQQVYSSTAFAGAIDIGRIDFFNTVTLNGGEPASGTFGLSLSYTSKAPGGLDLSNPANNIGFGNQTFFTGTLPSLLGGMLEFGGTPFLYNPALGNLLLTVSIASGADGTPFLFLDQTQTGAQTNRAFFGTTNLGNDGGGLVTGFASAVPEPSSVLLVATALLAVGCRFRRRLL